MVGIDGAFKEIDMALGSPRVDAQDEDESSVERMDQVCAASMALRAFRDELSCLLHNDMP